MYLFAGRSLASDALVMVHVGVSRVSAPVSTAFHVNLMPFVDLPYLVQRLWSESNRLRVPHSMFWIGRHVLPGLTRT